MADHDTIELSADTRAALRNEPVQARSTARLTALLDAAAAVVDEIGFERLTTAMVAERAGASIGTVYRYFPDRIALLQALGARNLERVLTRVSDEVQSPSHSDWRTAVTAALGILVEAYRTEPGFRGLRVGDVIDLRPAPSERPFNGILSDRIVDGLVARFGITDDASTRLAFEAAVEVSDALATRAFARDRAGDATFLAIGRDTAIALLSERLG